jgi:hypothetical protein
MTIVVVTGWRARDRPVLGLPAGLRGFRAPDTLHHPPTRPYPKREPDRVRPGEP